VMPDTMSQERRNLLRAYGAKLYLTPGAKGMKGAIEKAEKLQKEHGYFMPQQFENEANPVVHAKTTGREIVQQMEDGLDAFISGGSKSGTVNGVGKVIKKEFSNVKINGREPVKSGVLSGNDPGAHKIQGIWASFFPKVLNKEFYDDI